MSRLQVDTLVNATNTGSPSFPFGAPGDISLPFRLHASYPPDTFLTIEAAEVGDSMGSGRVQPAGAAFITPRTFPTTTIDFSTGSVAPSNALTISFPTTTAGSYRLVAFAYNLATSSASGYFSSEEALLSSLPDPSTLLATDDERLLGWIEVEGLGGTAYKTAGSLTDIIEGRVQGAGAFRIHNIVGGGGGSTDELQDVYERTDVAPATITTSSALGDLTVAGSEALSVTAAKGLRLVQSASTDSALNIQHSSASSTQPTAKIVSASLSRALDISATDTTSVAALVALTAAGQQRALQINLSNIANVEPAVFVNHGGSGPVFSGIANSTGAAFVLKNQTVGAPIIRLENAAGTAAFQVIVPTALVSYALTLPPAQGSSNTFLRNDGAGVLTWVTASALGTTLQDSYLSGNTITTAASPGDLIVTGSEALSLTAAKGLSISSGQLKLGLLEDQYFDAITLNDNSVTATAASALTYPVASFEGIEITYKIKGGATEVRVGKIFVANSATAASIVDSFAETVDLGVTWTAVINGANVELRYTTTNSGSARTMRAEVKRVRA